jgi:hypothetical protein
VITSQAGNWPGLGKEENEMKIGDEVLVKGRIIRFDAGDNTFAIRSPGYRMPFWAAPKDITVIAQQADKPAASGWHPAAQKPKLFAPLRLKLADDEIVIGCHGSVYFARADKGYIPDGSGMGSENGFGSRAWDRVDAVEWQYIQPGEYQTTPPTHIDDVVCLLKSGKERLGWFECREPGGYPAGWHLRTKDDRGSAWEYEASTKVIAWRKIK